MGSDEMRTTKCFQVPLSEFLVSFHCIARVAISVRGNITHPILFKVVLFWNNWYKKIKRVSNGLLANGFYLSKHRQTILSAHFLHFHQTASGRSSSSIWSTSCNADSKITEWSERTITGCTLSHLRNWSVDDFVYHLHPLSKYLFRYQL